MATTESWPGAGSQSSRQARPLPGPGVLSSRTWAALQHRVGAGRLSRWPRGAAASLLPTPETKENPRPLDQSSSFPPNFKRNGFITGIIRTYKEENQNYSPKLSAFHFAYFFATYLCNFSSGNHAEYIILCLAF